MTRSNFLYIIPAIIIFIYQRNLIWKKLPEYSEEQTLIQGGYGNTQRIGVVLIFFLLLLIFIYQIFYTVFPIFIDDTKIHLIIGYVLLILGAFIYKWAVQILDSSWSPIAFFRIKKHQQLVVSGIYKYTRHPIYLSIILQCVGYELIVNSWFFLPILFFLFTIFRKHILKEERLLINYWGKKYLSYKDKTKMLFPFIY